MTVMADLGGVLPVWSGAAGAVTTSDGQYSAGVAVAFVCSVVAFAFGMAHYRGFAPFFLDTYVISPYSGLAPAWLGAGGILGTPMLLLPDDAPWLLALPATVAGLVGLVAAVIGLVAIVWLPRRLQPRWMRERLAWRREHPTVWVKVPRDHPREWWTR